MTDIDTAALRDLEIHKRLDMRRTVGDRGHGPDDDEPRDALAVADASRLTSGAFPFTAEGGFWKESEDKACRLGLPMVSDDRGLPPGYMDNR